jgi:hypothetical protein
MMIARSDIIEGLVSMSIVQTFGSESFKRTTKSLEILTNDQLSFEYFMATGSFVRQIFSNTFISLP